MTLKRSLPAIVLLIATILCSAFFGRRSYYSPKNALDFICYYEAAYLIHEGRGANLYQGADTGVNPQMRIALPQDGIGTVASQLGRSMPGFYLYPPLLADLLVPLSYLPLNPASWLWLGINVSFLGVAIFFILDLFSLRFWSLPSLALVLGLMTMDATLMTLEIGQVTALLLLLWIGGICAYKRGNLAVSAFCFALSAVLKLTPVLVVIPFLLWMEWKWLRWFAIFVFSLVAVMCWFNSPAVVVNFFQHVMPSMGAGFPSFENKSLVSGIELVYMTSHGFGITPPSSEVPKYLVSACKLLSVTLIGAASYLIWRAGPKLDAEGRSRVLALVALFSACISPISWRHAYVMAFIPLAFLWKDAISKGMSNLNLAILAICTVELTTFHFDYLTLQVLQARPISFGIASCEAPLAGLVLVFLMLFEISKNSNVSDTGRVSLRESSLDANDIVYRTEPIESSL